MDEDFWEDLLALIEDRKVVPVIGERAVTMAPGDTPLYDWLGLQLAERLGIPSDALPDKPSLNQVVTAWLLKGGERNKIYTRLHRLLRDGCLTPGSTLCSLAEIPAFNLFLTTTFDRLLERAVNEVRFGGAERTRVCAFWPEASEKDLPARKKDLSVPTIYHVLGKVSSAPEFVAWEEDALGKRGRELFPSGTFLGCKAGGRLFPRGRILYSCRYRRIGVRIQAGTTHCEACPMHASARRKPVPVFPRTVA